MHFLEVLKGLLKHFETGRIILAHGHYEWKFNTSETPSMVFISEVECGCHQVCHGDVNTFGVTKLEDGFVLNAHVETDHAEILWVAVTA